jgi:prepilin-type N-terminal cleavage/methylation domain-containing protein
MYKNSKKGFTLIELLVVIAIIGVLAAVALPALNSARNKGNDAAIKSDLDGLRVQSELYYSNHGNSYTNLCGDSTLANGFAGITSNSGTYVCNVSTAGDAWAISSTLKSGGAWCVDSTGSSTPKAANLASGAANSSCNY